jgi:hypothetical protein
MPTDNSLVGAIPPGVDPAQWLKTQRQMQLAQALQGFSLSPVQNDIQQPGGGGKYYQAARVRPIAALSKLAEALMAKRGFDQAAPAMAQQYSQGMQAFSPGGQVSSPVTPASSQVPPVSSPQGAAAPSAQPQIIPQNPMNPAGLPPGVAMRAYMSDPSKYAELLAGTPEWRTALAAAGGNQQRAMQMLQQEATKKGTITMRGGEMALLPNAQGGYDTRRSPNLPPGFEPKFDQQGQYVGTQPAPGLIAGQAAEAGATTAAREANTPLEVDMGGGVRKLSYPGDVLPPAPATRQQGAPGGQKQYFQGGPPQAPLPQPPPSVRGGAAQAMGAQPEQGMWASVPKLSIPNTPGETTDTFHAQLLKDAAAKHEELVNKYGSDADLADARIAFNKEALGVLNGAETGPLSDELTKLRAKAQELGVPPSWIPGSDTVADTQLLKKFALRNPLLNLKPTFGGRPAASEFQILANDASPSPSQMKSVFSRLATLDTQQAEYTKQKSEDYGTYVSKGGDPMRFESWYANRKPLANYFAQKATPAAALERLKQRPETLADFKSAFGWDPTAK